MQYVLDPDQDGRLFGLDLGSNCLEGYQQMTKVTVTVVPTKRDSNVLLCLQLHTPLDLKGIDRSLVY